MSGKKLLKRLLSVAFITGMLAVNIAQAGTVIIIGNPGGRPGNHEHQRPQHDYDRDRWPYYPGGYYYPPPPPQWNGGYPPGHWQQPWPDYNQNNRPSPPRRDYRRLPSHTR